MLLKTPFEFREQVDYDELLAAYEAVWQRTQRSGVIAIPNLTIHICDPNFTTLKTLRTRNKFLKWGRANLRNLMGYPILSGSGSTPSYIALGTDSTAVQDGDLGVITEVYRALITRRTANTDGSSNESIRFQMLVGANDANGNTLTEASLESADVSDTLPSGEIGSWTRATYSSIVKTNAISVIYEWEIGMAST